MQSDTKTQKKLFVLASLPVSTGMLVECFVPKPSLPVKGRQLPFFYGR